MRITHLRLENWKNFKEVDLPLQRRAFVVGPNASGKSNLLDAIRFLRDLSHAEGGYQRAVRPRGGVSRIRCLHARAQPNVALQVTLQIDSDKGLYRVDVAKTIHRVDSMRRG